MFITSSACQKIESLVEPNRLFRISVSGLSQVGFHIDFDLGSFERTNDTIIWNEPKIVADIISATHLANQTLDYNLSSDEFVLSNRRQF